MRDQAGDERNEGVRVQLRPMRNCRELGLELEEKGNDVRTRLLSPARVETQPTSRFRD